MKMGMTVKVLRFVAVALAFVPAVHAVPPVANAGPDRTLRCSLMAPDRVRTASVGVLSGIRSPECVRLVVRELDSLPVDVSHLEYGSRLVGLARSFGEEAARTALAGYAERLKAARPADPVSGGYFDQKIAEVRKAVESVEEAGPRM